MDLTEVQENGVNYDDLLCKAYLRDIITYDLLNVSCHNEVYM